MASLFIAPDKICTVFYKLLNGYPYVSVSMVDGMQYPLVFSDEIEFNNFMNNIYSYDVKFVTAVPDEGK